MEVPHSTFILYLLTVMQLRESGEILTGFKLGIRSDWFVKLTICILHLLCIIYIFFTQMKRYIQIYLHRVIPPNRASCIFRNCSICKATIKLKEREKDNKCVFENCAKEEPL